MQRFATSRNTCLWADRFPDVHHCEVSGLQFETPSVPCVAFGTFPRDPIDAVLEANDVAGDFALCKGCARIFPATSTPPPEYCSPKCRQRIWDRVKRGKGTRSAYHSFRARPRQCSDCNKTFRPMIDARWKLVWQRHKMVSIYHHRALRTLSTSTTTPTNPRNGEIRNVSN